MPYTPSCPLTGAMSSPATHVHSPLLNFHRSLRTSTLPVESMPVPPNSQRFPAESLHELASTRAPGVFAEPGMPFVPYMPGGRPRTNPGVVDRFDPDIQVHWPLLYLHRSLRLPRAPVESMPRPPKSQKLP